MLRRPVSALALALGLGLPISLSLASPAFGKSYVEGEDRFQFTYEYKIPDLEKGDQIEVWLPVATSGPFQTVKASIDAPGLTIDTTKEAKFGNHLAHTKADASASGKMITVTYSVDRKEKQAYAAGPEVNDPAYLRAEPLMPLNERFKKLAAEITKGKTTTEEKGRAIYDYVFKEMKYDKSGTGWGRGDAVYACDSKTGNCTDFHALFIVLARSAGIPARFAIGFSVPSDGQAKVIDGYHCWAEFAADGKWVPVDISEAWKDQATKDYYFGHHPANRFELTRGQQLELVPAAHSGPLVYLVHPYVEINGKMVKGTKGIYAFKPEPTSPAVKT